MYCFFFSSVFVYTNLCCCCCSVSYFFPFSLSFFFFTWSSFQIFNFRFVSPFFVCLFPSSVFMPFFFFSSLPFLSLSIPFFSLPLSIGFHFLFPLTYILSSFFFSSPPPLSRLFISSFSILSPCLSSSIFRYRLSPLLLVFFVSLFLSSNFVPSIFIFLSPLLNFFIFCPSGGKSLSLPFFSLSFFPFHPSTSLFFV